MEKRNKNDLIKHLTVSEVNYDKAIVLKVIKNYPEETDVLLSAKNEQGKPLLDLSEINDIIFNCYKLETFNPADLEKILSSPDIEQSKNKLAEVRHLMGRREKEPFPMTSKNIIAFLNGEKFTTKS